MKLFINKHVSSVALLGMLAVVAGCGGSDAGQEQERIATPTPEPAATARGP